MFGLSPVSEHSERTEADDAVAVLVRVQHRAVHQGADSGQLRDVGKYIFYIINSVAALLLWTRSGTAAKGTVAVA